ncbi:RNA polymerase factor sigma-54 [Granulicella aggregans]|uniref:RNA polymerase factor sigma-54 n=1 Tax=Granulicella aggregans TaxID=474949 RepID=UPI001618F7D9
MVLQPKLNLKVSQRQALTPGLVQMVSVLALNKLELREMINTEMIENPVLEELEESVSTLEERSGLEGDRERSAEEVAAESERVEKDPFDEIDFGSYFQEYLDPGFKTASNFEEYDKPSFENFLSQPSTLTDHLTWQLGSLPLTPAVRAAADLIIGNLNADGYLTATDEELVEFLQRPVAPGRLEPISIERGKKHWPAPTETSPAEDDSEAGLETWPAQGEAAAQLETSDLIGAVATAFESGTIQIAASVPQHTGGAYDALHAALDVVHQLDPIGVGARDLRECLLLQIEAQQREAGIALKRRERYARQQILNERNGFDLDGSEEPALNVAVAAEPASGTGANVFEIALHIVSHCLALLQKKDMRELTRSCGASADKVQAAVDFIRTLDPRPGQRYNHSETRLIEPDVAFVKRDGEYVVLMNEEEMPTLRLNQGYRKMLRQKQTEKDVREYVKERYKSAIQLLRNIEQRKNTIVRTCEVIVRRQAEFLEHGESALRPMMIKEVAEEIGVHPSTVSRAVANKYVHTTQGVYELRFFFSEGVNGPEGGDLPLVLLKRKVKKLIEDEDSRKPLTDDQLAAELQRQGIQVTRRTVAKYREDMQIPSTHQRRVR